MSEIITCPAPLRANSPAVLVQDVYVSAPGYSEAVALLRKGERVTVIEVTDTFARVALRSSMVAPATGSASWLTYVVEVSALEMDLTDATGRAHATWWVASQVPECTSLAPIWTPLSGPSRASLEVSWMMMGEDEDVGFTACVEALAFQHYIVPALADLDPTDDTRLPDGSRVVDALALKAVVEHLIAQRGEK